MSYSTENTVRTADPTPSVPSRHRVSGSTAHGAHLWPTALEVVNLLRTYEQVYCHPNLAFLERVTEYFKG